MLSRTANFGPMAVQWPLTSANASGRRRVNRAVKELSRRFHEAKSGHPSVPSPGLLRSEFHSTPSEVDRQRPRALCAGLLRVRPLRPAGRDATRAAMGGRAAQPPSSAINGVELRSPGLRQRLDGAGLARSVLSARGMSTYGVISCRPPRDSNAIGRSRMRSRCAVVSASAVLNISISFLLPARTVTTSASFSIRTVNPTW